MGMLRHHMAEDLRRLMHGPVHVANKAEPASKADRRDADATHLRMRFFLVPSMALLLRHLIHFKIALRRDSEGVRNPIEEREHRGDVDGFGDLRLRPAMIPQLLHIFDRWCDRPLPSPWLRNQAARVPRASSPASSRLPCAIACTVFSSAP